jgi:hypothetical protein
MGNDWFDFPTLNYWTRNDATHNMQDVVTDLCSGTHALELFLEGLMDGLKQYHDEAFIEEYLKHLLVVFLEGNHDWRSKRLFQEDRRLARLFPQPQWIVRKIFKEWGVNVTWVDWKKSICVDEVVYAHAAINPASGKPMGGQARSKLTRLKSSTVIGHHVGKDMAEEFTTSGRKMRFIQAGSFYLDAEDYSPNDNYWVGLLYFHDVKDGYFNVMEVDMEYLWKKFDDMTGDILADGTWREEMFVKEGNDEE